MTLTLLIVVIGLMNICLGFGLSIYLGYAPASLEAIFQSLGPMPPAPPSIETLLPANMLGEPYDPFAPSSEAVSQASEESVLGEVQQLAESAQSAMAVAQET